MSAFFNPGRLAGFGYLTLIVAGVYSYLVVHAALDTSDPQAFADHLRQHTAQYSVGFLTELLMVVGWMFMGILFKQLFSAQFPNMSRALWAFILVPAAITCGSTLFHMAPVLILNSATLASEFTQGQLQALALLFFKFHEWGYYSAQVFFGLWLFPLGYIVFFGQYFGTRLSQFIGFFLMLGCFSYLIDLGVAVVFPDVTLPFWVTIPPDIGEFSMALALLILGIKTPNLDGSVTATGQSSQVLGR